MDPVTGEVWACDFKDQGFMKVFNNAYSPDIILEVGTDQNQRQFNVHEAIISKASDYLKERCQTADQEDGKKVINLLHLNIDPEAMRSGIRWIYGDPYAFADSCNSSLSCANIMIAASKLGIENLGVAVAECLREWQADVPPSSTPEFIDENFTEPGKYWKLIRSISNWTHGWNLNSLVQLTKDTQTSLPPPPPWITNLASEANCNPTLLAALLLERQQVLLNFSPCEKCKERQKEKSKLTEPGHGGFQCWNCETIGPEMVSNTSFIKIETITPEPQQASKTGQIVLYGDGKETMLSDSDNQPKKLKDCEFENHQIQYKSFGNTDSNLNSTL
ncbi:hypothetical protein TWF679_005309 [Orbilia oligospora]|uniref:BTB domain-containing protein n=1 Tax=Orbilia oligospora TaxID=2813651 RepID=A0A8H8VCF9_ORBOL|nr:hypothetical protein TWF679_005309 [Orbilia oligospora]